MDPTTKESDDVQLQIERLQASRFQPERGWMRPSDAPDSVPWSGLTEEQRLDVLSSSVRWEGFDASQIVDVARRVADGEGRDHWMDGVGGEPVAPDPVMERVVAGVENSLVAREALLEETYRLEREVGYAGFRREFIDDPATAEEWPDPSGREAGLRRAWDEIADFNAYRRSHAEAGLDALTAHRDRLLGLQAGPEDVQLEYYRSVQAVGREGPEAGNDNEPGWRDEFAAMMRDIADPPQFPDLATEADKLRLIEGTRDWTGMGDRDKEAILAREVDFSGITRSELNSVYEGLGSDDIDERPARRLFDEANYARAVAEADRSGFDEQLRDVRPTTRDLIESVMFDGWPRGAAVVDFGIDSQQHYKSLYHPIRNEEVAPSVLDAAMGNGARLTDLVREAPSNPHKDIEFRTSWDVLLGRERPGPPDRDPPAGPGRAMETDYHQMLREAVDEAKFVAPARGKEIER